MADATKYEPAPVEEPPVYSDNTVEAQTEEPPKYDSLFAQLKGAKENASNPIQFASKTLGILGGSVWITVSLIPSIGLPIAMIIIGVLYKDKCPLERFIPLWLIIFGSCATFTAVFKAFINLITLLKKRKNPEYSPPTAGNCLNNLIGLFLFAWFIAGNVWVYKNYQKVSYDSSDTQNYCNKLCYLFSFWVLNIIWGSVVLACCCFCGVIVCVGGIGLCCAFSAKK